VTEPLRLICVDLPAPPLFDKADPDGTRRGYEPSAAEIVAERMGRTVQWVMTAWSDMIPAVNGGRGDAIWCGQGITAERTAVVDFTRPYAVFDESVLVRAGASVTGPQDLSGKRVAAIAGSTNMALASTFPGAITVAFDGASDDVFGDMVSALRRGDVDAVVDDDVALVPLGDQQDLEVAFTVPTRNRWGVAVAKGNDALRRELDAALDAAITDGSLEQQWKRWMPGLAYPFSKEAESRSA
jgi:polar amino acid transport system substrate-binding protein